MVIVRCFCDVGFCIICSSIGGTLLINKVFVNPAFTQKICQLIPNPSDCPVALRFSQNGPPDHELGTQPQAMIECSASAMPNHVHPDEYAVYIQRIRRSLIDQESSIVHPRIRIRCDTMTSDGPVMLYRWFREDIEVTYARAGYPKNVVVFFTSLEENQIGEAEEANESVDISDSGIDGSILLGDGIVDSSISEEGWVDYLSSL